MTGKQKALETLIQLATEIGTDSVKDACKEFLKLKSLKPVDKRQVIPRAWVKQAWLKQGGRCSRCKRPLARDEASGDHVVAITRGGEHQASNIVAMHKGCNSSKGSNDLLLESTRSRRTFKDMFNEEIEGDVDNG